MPKVSIIVPVYNIYSYLEKCLISLVKQTLYDIEIIIVNDGSKDDSQQIIDKFAYQDKRIKFYIKENGGLSDARNFGIKHAKGDYIGFVDGDDYVDEKMFEKLYNKAIKNNSDIVECNFYWSYDNKMIYDQACYYNSTENIMANIRVMVCNKLFKTAIIKSNKITFPIGLNYEDILFTYKVLAVTNKISYLDEGLYYYIQRQSSISNKQNERVKDIFVILENLKDYYKLIGKYDKYKYIIEYLYIRYLLGSSYLRILGIKNKQLKKTILNENWQFLNNNYPNWKKNNYLNKNKTLKNIYYRFTSKFTYNIFSYIFKFKYRRYHDK